MNNRQVDLKVIAGGAAVRSSEKIAFSLVHPLQCIDVPVGAVLDVEAQHDQTFQLDDGSSRTFPTPHVRVTLAPDIRERLYRLTHTILRYDLHIKTLDIVIAGLCLSSPVIREPIGSLPYFSISANDFAEAEVLAAKLRAGFVRTDLRVVGGKHRQ
jgi:preprotein translocase subunit SecD